MTQPLDENEFQELSRTNLVQAQHELMIPIEEFAVLFICAVLMLSLPFWTSNFHRYEREHYVYFLQISVKVKSV
jgi:hypothetical protein